MCLGLPAPRLGQAHPLGHPVPAQILCVGKFQPRGRGWGQGPAAKPPLPGRAVSAENPQLTCTGPGLRLSASLGQRFPAAGKSLRENRLLPTPARPRPAALSRGDGLGHARTRRDPPGIAASGFCSPKEGATGTDAYPQVFPGPPSGPVIQPCRPRGCDDRCPLPTTNPPRAAEHLAPEPGAVPQPWDVQSSTEHHQSPDTDPAAALAGASQHLSQGTPGLVPGGSVWCWAVLGGDKHPQRGHVGGYNQWGLYPACIKPGLSPTLPQDSGEHALGEATVPGQIWEARGPLPAQPGRKG